MAHTAIPEEEIEELRDDEARVDECAARLVRAIKKHRGKLVVYTGAGVSTSMGIPSFRGPEGVWTVKAKLERGEHVPEATLRKLRAWRAARIVPSRCHMALVALQEAGVLSHLVSTNCDGMHLRSGMRPDKLIELHGNGDVEACPVCGRLDLVDEHAKSQRLPRNRARITGRRCTADGCTGLMRSTTVAFNQSMPDVALRGAERYSKRAQVVLVLGTSMRVSPACELPFLNDTAVSCIVNLQRTPYDAQCSIRVHAETDRFMEKVMAGLGIEIPQYRELDLAQDDAFQTEMRRVYKFRSAPDDSWFAGGHDVDLESFRRGVLERSAST